MNVTARARRLAAPVGTPAASSVRRVAYPGLAAALAPLHRPGGRGLGACVRGAAAREACRRARHPGRARALGERGRRAGDLPREPVHAPPRRLRRPREPPRVCVLPRTAGNRGLPGVRRVLPEADAAPRRDRRRPGDKRGDGVARARDGDRGGEGAPDPDRHRPGRVPVPDGRRQGPSPPGARASRHRLRRRLVPEGRRRLGRRAGAQADQGPGRPGRGGLWPTRARPRPVVPAHRPLAGLRQGGARARRHPLSAPLPSEPRVGGAGVRGDRPLHRCLA